MDFESVVDWVPGGRLTIVALGLLAVPSVRRKLRPVAKTALRVGLTVTDQVKEWTAEVREQAGDMVAEIKEEREADRGGAVSEGAAPHAPARRRATGAEA